MRLGGGGASAGPGSVLGTDDRSGGFLPPVGEFVLPGVLIGIPVVTVLLILATQLVAGTVWLPAIRRWLNRPLLPDEAVTATDDHVATVPGDQSL